MLFSFLVNLSAAAQSPILGPLGRPAGSWFLRQVTRHNPELGARLHAPGGKRPYSASTLLDDRGRPLQAGSWLRPGQEVWMRFTTLGSEMSNFCLSTLFPKLPGNVTIYKMPFRMLGWTYDPAQHPWAGHCSFQELAQQKAENLSSQVGLEFASPTAFRQGGADLPLPLPGQVFRSYWEKWNAFAPPEMSIDTIWPDFATSCIVVSEISGLNTDRWEFADGARGAATGFTGIVHFNLLPKHARSEMADYWDGADLVMHTLVRFSFYCGTGHHTTIGLGQTRPLSPPR